MPCFNQMSLLLQPLLFLSLVLMSKHGGSSLSGLASLAGINLGGVEGSSEFPPTLYPQVVESVPFKLELLSSSIINNGDELTLRDYFNNDKGGFNLGTLKKYTIGLPSLIFGSFKNEDENSLNSIFIVFLRKMKIFLKIEPSSFHYQ